MIGRSLSWLALAGVLGSSNLALAAASHRPHKVIRLDSITVEGHLQEPQAFYLLQRSNLNFEELERTESFIPKIIKSVDKEPF